MKPQLHHAALQTADFDWYVNFFQKVFSMEVRKTSGEAPDRKVWFHEGIQLNEGTPADGPDGAYNHIAIAVPDIPSYAAAALEAGCTPLPQGGHWVMLPNGVKLELMQG